jgi:hypothetical protein
MHSGFAMLLEHGISHEAFATLVTEPGFVPTVPKQMGLEMNPLNESFTAEFAYVGAILGVSLNVLPEGGGRGEGRATVEANVVSWPVLGRHPMHSLDVLPKGRYYNTERRQLKFKMARGQISKLEVFRSLISCAFVKN